MATNMFSEVFHDFHMVDLLPNGFQHAALGVLLLVQSMWRRQVSVPGATCLVCFLKIEHNLFILKCVLMISCSTCRLNIIILPRRMYAVFTDLGGTLSCAGTLRKELYSDTSKTLTWMYK